MLLRQTLSVPVLSLLISPCSLVCILFLAPIHRQHCKYIEVSSTHDHPDAQLTQAAMREADKDLLDREKAKERLVRWHCFGRTSERRHHQQ